MTNGCSDQQKFLRNIRLVNERAGVEPEVVDLIEAYALLRLRRGHIVDFYPTPDVSRKNDVFIEEFLKNNLHLDHRLLRFFTSYFRAVSATGVRCIINPAHLASILEVSTNSLQQFSKSANNYYHTFTIAKSDGTPRLITAPSPDLKRLQRKILDMIVNAVPLNGAVEGFRTKRSILTNATRHVRKKIVVKLDIVDFFPTITRQRVFGAYRYLGYPRGVCRLLTDLAVFNSRLPMGAPTSPALANIVCRKLDARLAGLGRKCEFEYSRYADDLTFSSNSDKLVTLLPLLRRIVGEEGFVIHEKKVRVMRNGARQKVTGLVVNDKPNLSREDIRKLRALLHNCSKNGVHHEAKSWFRRQEKGYMNTAFITSSFLSSLQAKIGFVKMVNPSLGKKFMKQFRELNWES
jgi:RNA-directed DNA polymerase